MTKFVLLIFFLFSYSLKLPLATINWMGGHLVSSVCCRRSDRPSVSVFTLILVGGGIISDKDIYSFMFPGQMDMVIYSCMLPGQVIAGKLV